MFLSANRCPLPACAECCRRHVRWPSGGCCHVRPLISPPVAGRRPCGSLRRPCRGRRRRRPRAAAAQGFRILRARPGSAHLRGPDQPPTAIWGYDGVVPGPVLRVKRGQELHVRLINELPEETTIHWHGVRVPNAMDGVPHLTQAPVPPGGTFDYRFKPPRRRHLLVPPAPACVRAARPRPLGRADRRGGGAGRSRPRRGADARRLAPQSDGQNDEASFRSFHDAAHAGRIGRT